MTDPTTTMSAAEKRALIEKLLAQRMAAPADVPLSVYQEPLWLFEQIKPGTPIYNNSLVVRFLGTLDLDMLEQALRTVVRRHDALRTAFVQAESGPVQHVLPTVEILLPVRDLRATPADARLEEARRVIRVEVRRAFDFATPPLMRALLVALEDHDHVLVITAHQIVCDGWSTTVLLTDLTTAYTDLVEGRPSSLAKLPLRYADVAVQQQAPAAKQAVQDDLSYWAAKLDGAPPASEWPTDRPRPPRPTGAGGFASQPFDAELSARIREVSKARGVTPFMTLLAALYATHARHSGQTDLVLGIPTAGRDDPRTAPLIGCFVNSLALRTTVTGGMTFEALLTAVRQTAIEALSHQTAAFARVCDVASVPRDSARAPLFQVFFNMLNLPSPSLTVPGATVQHVPIIENDAKFDLALYVSAFDTGWSIDVVYSRDLYRDGTVKSLLARYLRALDAVTRNPSLRIADLPLEPAAPPVCVSPIAAGPGFAPTPIAAIDSSIPARIAEHVGARATQAAVIGRSGTWTYGDLGAHVAAVAREIAVRLARTRADSGHAARTVALLCDNDTPMTAAVLGTLATGQAYVPLDPLSPTDRLRFVLDDAGATLVVCDRANRVLAETLVGRDAVIEVEACAPAADDRPLQDLAAPIAPDALAYVLYTSGSTGQPKGVMQSHRNVLQLSRVYTDNLRIAPADRLSLMAAYGFDAAVMDIFGALLTGATLVIADVRQRGLEDIAAWIHTHRVTVFHSTPTVFRQSFTTDLPRAALASLRAVVLGGEEALAADLERFTALCPAGAWLVNGLGPTESTVTMQAFFAHGSTIDGRSLPVGVPVEGTRIELVDADGLPSDLHGELVIHSPSIALGYWRRPELTAASFGGDPSSGGVRSFRTGDLLRRLPAGGYEFLGRRDHQVKVRGFRIELGEIETSLAAHPTVRHAVVLPRETDGGTVLAAFVDPAPDASPDPRELRRWLKNRLPEYMLPGAVHVLPSLPMTANGKLLRGALAAIDPAALNGGVPAGSAAPRPGVEQRLAGLWQAVLGVHHVARDDDFFVLGGHSLRAMQLVPRIAREFGVSVPLRTIFDASTLDAQAQAIADRLPAGLDAIDDDSREEIEI